MEAEWNNWKHLDRPADELGRYLRPGLPDMSGELSRIPAVGNAMGQRGLKGATDVEYYAGALGAEFVFAVARFETRVVVIRLEAPELLLAEHPGGEQAILIFRVAKS